MNEPTLDSTQRAKPQASAYAHETPHETCITVYVGGTKILTLADGDRGVPFKREASASDEAEADLFRAAWDFAQAAAELSVKAMEAHVPDPFGEE